VTLSFQIKNAKNVIDKTKPVENKNKTKIDNG
jgi:hypothetical protein